MGEVREGVELTSLDSPLGDGLEVTKRDLVDYLDAFADRLLPQLAGRPLSVKRVRPGQPPFMQRNVSRGAPEWVRTVAVWSWGANREVHQVSCSNANRPVPSLVCRRDHHRRPHPRRVDTLLHH